MDMDSGGLRLSGRVKGIALPIETAAKMSVLHGSMPESKRSELRQRILGSDYLTPILMEIDMAAHFYQMGFEVEWLELRVGQRTADFICRSQKAIYEVECKSKTVDAGRMVARPRFYRLVDLIIDRLRSQGLCGEVSIALPGDLPGQSEWQTQLVEKVINLGQGPAKEGTLVDGTFIMVSLITNDDIRISKQEFHSKLNSARRRSRQIEIDSTETSRTTYTNPLLSG